MKNDVSPETVVALVVAQPELLREIYRRLGWLDRAALIAVREDIDSEIERQERLLGACREGVFGRDYVARLRADVTKRKGKQ